MDSKTDFDLQQLPPQLQSIATTIQEVAQASQHDTQALLDLLRLLESLHREIRDDLFQPTLPTNRHALYDLLRDIEMKGGWPYIPRMRVQMLLSKLDRTVLNELSSPLDRLSSSHAQADDQSDMEAK